MMMKLVFASANPNKVLEMSAKLGGWPIQGLADIGCMEELPETGETLEENAAEKAGYVYSHYMVDCFADDTGLEIDALNGAPGVHTAYYGGPDRSALNNMKKVLEELEGSSNRKAKFKTVIHLIDNGIHQQFIGICEGQIALEPAGSGGFGYDPIFIPDGYDQTFGQLPAEVKNHISHRARALEKLKQYLAKKNQ